MTNRIRALALAAVLALAACTDRGEPEPAPTEGCTKVDTGDKFADVAYSCPDKSTVFLFESTEERDRWLRAAEVLGGDIESKGDRWVKVAP